MNHADADGRVSYRYELIACGQALQKKPYKLHQPIATEVLLRVLASGLCHTDLHLAEGFFDMGNGNRIALSDRGIHLPHTLGHESVGEVIALGPDVHDLNIGDRVLIYPWIGCDACKQCAENNGHLCGQPQFIGVFRSGGFSDHVVVPHSRYLFPINDLAAAQAAPLACSGLTTYGALMKVRGIFPAEPIVIIGAGGLGLMCLALLAKLQGHGAVVIEPSEMKRDAALRLGARCAVGTDQDSHDQLALLAGDGYGAVLDFVGSAESIARGVSLLRKGGKLIVVGMFGGAMTVPIPLLVMRGISIEGSYVGSLAEMSELLELVKKTGLPNLPIVIRPMSQINDAFDDMRIGHVLGRTVFEP